MKVLKCADVRRMCVWELQRWKSARESVYLCTKMWSAQLHATCSPSHWTKVPTSASQLLRRTIDGPEQGQHEQVCGAEFYLKAPSHMFRGLGGEKSKIKKTFHDFHTWFPFVWTENGNHSSFAPISHAEPTCVNISQKLLTSTVSHPHTENRQPTWTTLEAKTCCVVGFMPMECVRWPASSPIPDKWPFRTTSLRKIAPSSTYPQQRLSSEKQP